MTLGEDSVTNASEHLLRVNCLNKKVFYGLSFWNIF